MELYFEKEGKDKLIIGVNKLVKAVGSTLGPNGKTVIIPSSETYGEYTVTKDGVSVAKAIKLKDPVENIGAKLIRQAAEETVKKAGDGTTTATVLAGAFINNLKDFPPQEVNKAFDEIIPKVIEQLTKDSKKLNKEDIKYVASISANNDTTIGELIQEAFNYSDVIKIEKTSNNKDELITNDGMLLNTGMFSKHFMTNPSKGICELTSPHVLIIDGKLEDPKSVQYLLEEYTSNNNSLLIITEGVHEQLLKRLELIVLNDKSVRLCIMKTPGFGPHRKNLLEDLSKFTGAHIIRLDSNQKYNSTVLGKLKSCSISSKESILAKDDNVDYTDHLKNLISFYSTLTEDYDKELLLKRIDNLKGSLSIIKVGGYTEKEVDEKYDRYDDAVKAVKCALEEGIVEGGGIALYRVNQIVAKQIHNLQHDSIELGILKSINKPIDEIGIGVGNNMFYLNIIDPLKVTRTALENAVSVAKTILSTETIVIQENEWMN